MENKKGTYVYRFIDFLGFVNLVQNKNLAFVKPELWDDPFENYIFKKMSSRSGQKEIVKNLKELAVKDIPLKMIKLCLNNNSVFGQSWSLLKESDAMWRIYGAMNNCVRIKVSVDKIQKIMKDMPNCYCSPVKYKQKIDLKGEILHLFKGGDFNTLCLKGMLVKRNSFSHEKEFRLLYLEEDMISHYSDSIFYDEIKKVNEEGYKINEAFYDLLDKVNKVSREKDTVKKMPIDNPSKFISSVMLHPQAEDWVDETVRNYCKLNKIKYSGRSKLYEFS